MKKIINLITVFIILSCTPSNDENAQEVYIDSSILESADILQVDTIHFNRVFPYSKQIVKYNDSIVIVSNYGQENSYLKEFYNFKKDSIVKQLFHKGRGKDEVLSLTSYETLNSCHLLTGDYIKQEEYCINIDSLLQYPSYKIKKYGKIKVGGVYSFALFRNRLIAENPYRYCNEELGINQNLSTFICYDEDPSKTEIPNHKYETFDVCNTGQVITNNKKGVIMYAMQFYPIIELYNEDFKLIKRVVGLNDLKLEYNVKNKRVSFKGNMPHAFSNSFGTQDYVYLFYVGDYRADISKKKIDNYYILKLDWDGNLKRVYRTTYYLHTLTCENQTGKDIFFGSILDDKTGECHLLRLNSVLE